ncbi:hypothetical protein JL722_4357 [Aureococcus anophagefferens]|nr:hypothetical protein JL722_4357 [Aureococcus anophagefferens]
MSAFKRTRAERFAAFASTSTQEAGESRYWGRLKPSFACDFPSPISAVAFAPGEVRGPDGAPVYRVCVAAGLDVHVLSVGARLGSSWDAPRRKSVGRFKAVAQGACWRGDGRLIAVGDAEGAVHLVDAASGATLRRLAKGHGAGRAAKAACWGHDNSVCSAGADGTLVLWDVTTGAGVRRLWDLRQGGARAARTWDHGTRCETIVAVPGGNLFATAGGRDVALWDGLDDAVLHRFRDAHAKSATCLAVDGARTRLLSGGLDGLVKVHSLADHATVARAAATAPVKRSRVAKRARAPKLAAHDDALRGFRYKDALDEALKTRDPTVVVAVLEELDRRGGRAIALGDRDEKRLEPVLSFAAAHVAHPRYGSRLVPVVDALLDIDGGDLGAHPSLDELFAKIHKNATTEVGAMTALLGVSGALDALLATNRLRLDA